MLNVQFKLRKLRPDPLSVGRVFLVSYFNKKEFMFYTSLNATRSQWDEKKQIFRKNFDGWQKANLALENLKSIVINYEMDCILTQKALDAEELKRRLQGEKAEDKDKKPIWKWYEEFMQAKQFEGLKPASIRAHNATKEHFLEFIRTKAKGTTLDTYPDEVHHKFLAFLKSKRDYHPNYIGAIQKNLKVFFAYCVENGGKLATNHARLKRIYIPPKREFLTHEELKKWMSLDKEKWEAWYKEAKKQDGYFSALPTWEYAERTRDIFAFQAMTGLRHSDLFRLKPDHLIDLEGGGKALCFIPQKTTSVKNRNTKTVTVGLIPKALQILDKYKSEVYLLPVLHLRHYNKYIQYVGHAAGFSGMVEKVEYQKGVPVSIHLPKYQTLSSHVARHTFGTISRVFGVATDDLADLMGHSDPRTTKIYDHMANEYKAITQLKAWDKFDE